MHKLNELTLINLDGLKFTKKTRSSHNKVFYWIPADDFESRGKLLKPYMEAVYQDLRRFSMTWLQAYGKSSNYLTGIINSGAFQFPIF